MPPNFFARLFHRSEGAMTHIERGNAAPEFSVKSLDGRDYSLASLLATGPVVAAFFKISCPVCQFTFPFLERMHLRYGKSGTTFLGISQDDAKATKKFAEEYGVTFPMAIDESGRGYLASNAYGLTSVPIILLIEADKKIEVVCIGFDRKALEAIAASLSGRDKVAPAALFRPDERVPDYKPG
jgi:peroxiredoxin